MWYYVYKICRRGAVTCSGFFPPSALLLRQGCILRKVLPEALFNHEHYVHIVPEPTWCYQIFTINTASIMLCPYYCTIAWEYHCILWEKYIYQKIPFYKLSFGSQFNWKNTEKISMAPAQGWHAKIENYSNTFFFQKFCNGIKVEKMKIEKDRKKKIS